MKNTDPGKMTSDIARTACRNYKEDPKVVDEVKDWIIYKYGEQMKEEVAEKEKALRKEYEEKLKERLKDQKKESEDALRKQQVQIAKNLLSLSSMTISEIAAATKLEESEVKKISKE